jgi:hypothetical protein
VENREKVSFISYARFSVRNFPILLTIMRKGNILQGIASAGSAAVQASVCLALKPLAEQPMYRNCVLLCSFFEGKEVTNTVYISLVSLLAGFETNMLLIIFLGVMAKLTSVAGNCVAENTGVDNFNWDKVAISGLT